MPAHSIFNPAHAFSQAYLVLLRPKNTGILIVFSALNFDQKCAVVGMLSNPSVDIFKNKLRGTLHTDVGHYSQINNLPVMETTKHFNFRVILVYERSVIEPVREPRFNLGEVSKIDTKTGFREVMTAKSQFKAT